jgi:hypothetical protein
MKVVLTATRTVTLTWDDVEVSHEQLTAAVASAVEAHGHLARPNLTPQRDGEDFETFANRVMEQVGVMEALINRGVLDIDIADEAEEDSIDGFDVVEDDV